MPADLPAATRASNFLADSAAAAALAGGDRLGARRIGKQGAGQSPIAARGERKGRRARLCGELFGQYGLHGPQHAVDEAVPSMSADLPGERDRFADGSIRGDRIEKGELIRTERQKRPKFPLDAVPWPRHVRLDQGIESRGGGPLR